MAFVHTQETQAFAVNAAEGLQKWLTGTGITLEDLSELLDNKVSLRRLALILDHNIFDLPTTDICTVWFYTGCEALDVRKIPPIRVIQKGEPPLTSKRAWEIGRILTNLEAYMAAGLPLAAELRTLCDGMPKEAKVADAQEEPATANEMPSVVAVARNITSDHDTKTEATALEGAVPEERPMVAETQDAQEIAADSEDLVAKAWSERLANALTQRIAESGRTVTEIAQLLQLGRHKFSGIKNATRIANKYESAALWCLWDMPEADPEGIPPRRFITPRLSEYGFKTRAMTAQEKQAWLESEEGQQILALKKTFFGATEPDARPRPLTVPKHRSHKQRGSAIVSARHRKHTGTDLPQRAEPLQPEPNEVPVSENSGSATPHAPLVPAFVPSQPVIQQPAVQPTVPSFSGMLDALVAGLCQQAAATAVQQVTAEFDRKFAQFARSLKHELQQMMGSPPMAEEQQSSYRNEEEQVSQAIALLLGYLSKYEKPEDRKMRDELAHEPFFPDLTELAVKARRLTHAAEIREVDFQMKGAFTHGG